MSELADAILRADHAVASLVQLSLVPEFRRGHGALYAALADGRIDEDKLAALLTGTLPQLADGQEGRAWVHEHDNIDYGLLERALVGLMVSHWKGRVPAIAPVAPPYRWTGEPQCIVPYREHRVFPSAEASTCC